LNYKHIFLFHPLEDPLLSLQAAVPDDAPLYVSVKKCEHLDVCDGLTCSFSVYTTSWTRQNRHQRTFNSRTSTSARHMANDHKNTFETVH
jgi:hypothetical protein